MRRDSFEQLTPGRMAETLWNHFTHHDSRTIQKCINTSRKWKRTQLIWQTRTLKSFLSENKSNDSKVFQKQNGCVLFPPSLFLKLSRASEVTFLFFFLLSPWCSEMDCFHMTVTLKCLSVKQMCFSPKEWQPQLFLQRLQKKKETLPICKTKLWRKLWIIPICWEEIIKIGVTEMLGRGRPFFETHKRLLKSQNNKLLQ